MEDRNLFRIIRRRKGSAAILLTLLFISIVIAFFAIVEGAGRLALKSTAEASYDLAGRSILSMYDRDLLERYGLFAFQADNNALKSYLEMFANSTIETKDMSGGKSHVKNFETSAFSITNPDNFMAELDNLMNKIIVENIISSAASNFKDFKNQINEKKSLEDDTEQLTSSLEEARKKELENEDEDSGENNSDEMSIFEVISVQSQIRKIINCSIGYEACPEGGAVLRNSSIINDLPSVEADCRKNTAFSGIGNIISKFSSGLNSESIKEDIYINEYIMEFFENHLMKHDDKASLFHNEVEYILYGDYSDDENYKKAHRSIFVIRIASNMAYLLTDPEKKSEIMTVAEVLTPGPWARLTQLLITTAWSSVEAVNDMMNLELHNSVPLIKSDKTWKTDLSVITGGISSTRSIKPMRRLRAMGYIELNEGNMKYENYLRILLMTEDRDTKLYRIMDLIQINMKGSVRSDFLMEDHCAGFSFKADVSKKNLSRGFIKNNGDFTIDMSHTYVDLIKENYYGKEG